MIFDIPELLTLICTACDPVTSYAMSRVCRNWAVWTHSIAPASRWASITDDRTLRDNPTTEKNRFSSMEYRIASTFLQFTEDVNPYSIDRVSVEFITTFLAGTSIATHVRLHNLMFDQLTMDGPYSSFCYRLQIPITRAFLAGIGDSDTLVHWVYGRDYSVFRQNFWFDCVIEFCLDHEPKYNAVLLCRDPDWRGDDDPHPFSHIQTECPHHMPRFLQLHRGHTIAMMEIYTLTTTAKQLDDCYDAWNYSPPLSELTKINYFLWMHGLEYVNWWISRGYPLVEMLTQCAVDRREFDSLERFFVWSAILGDSRALEWAICDLGFFPMMSDARQISETCRLKRFDWQTMATALELLFAVVRHAETCA